MCCVSAVCRSHFSLDERIKRKTIAPGAVRIIYVHRIRSQAHRIPGKTRFDDGFCGQWITATYQCELKYYYSAQIVFVRITEWNDVSRPGKKTV